MNVLSLFDGMSCGQIALERAGFKIDNYYASEIDKYAIKVTQINYPKTIQLGCVSTIRAKHLPTIDLIIGGSPCTYWSISQTKNREITPDGLGFKLFMHYVRLIKECKPKYFLYENNLGIHQNIKNAITKHLKVEPIMINSALLSAQSRKRLYWTNIPNVTQPKDKKVLLKDIINYDSLTYQRKSYCLTANYNKAVMWNTIQKNQRTMLFKPIRLGYFNKGGQGSRIYSINGKSITISSGYGGLGAKTGLYRINLPDGEYIVRKLTPRECERLQTVPEYYTNWVSNTQQYKMLGNGWTVDVIKHIFNHIT